MNPLEVLELKPGATEEDASRSYRRLSLLHHPDKPTGNPDRFYEISTAYEYIRAHPEVLKDTEKRTNYYSPYVYVRMATTVEEIFREARKKITVNHNVLCGACGGTGSTLRHRGLCDTCGGKGTTESRAIRLVGRSIGGECPACSGTGVKPGTECKTCHGNRTVPKTLTHIIQLKAEHYHKKYILLQGQGDTLPDGTTSDLCVRLAIFEDPRYSFEGGQLCRRVLITPAQQYAGDTLTVDIFGKKVQCRVPAPDDEIIIEHYNPHTCKKCQILLRIETTKPILTERTRALYQKIVEEEKQLLNGQEPHSIEVPL